MGVTTRRAVHSDIPVIQDIERIAGRRFEDIGMEDIAADPPPSHEECAHSIAARMAWVAVDRGAPVAYLLASPIDGHAHIEQVSVLPEYAGRGLGVALIERLDDDARLRALAGLTLTTFVNVPWNAPYYRRLGFEDLEEQQLSAGLRAVRASEAALGLDRWPRTAMARRFDPVHPVASVHR